MFGKRRDTSFERAFQEGVRLPFLLWGILGFWDSVECVVGLGLGLEVDLGGYVCSWLCLE